MKSAIRGFIIAFVLVAGCNRGPQNSEASGQTKEQVRDLKERNVPMPAFPKLGREFWINGTPEIPENLKGKVVLVDFWDYTCVNCIRTLPYVTEWNRRYSAKGLLIIGVHAPEFEFSKERGNVEAAVKKFAISYPVVLDNDYGIWTIFGNKYWPAKYLFDKNGILRYYHYGEGNYGETETTIQKLLRELDTTVTLPAVMEPLRAEDTPGSVCYRSSPETYLGTKRGRIGNPEGLHEDDEVEYAAPAKLDEDIFYLTGRWKCLPQSIRLAGRNGEPGSILYNYAAAEANLVIHPESNRGFRVYCLQDGEPIPPGSRGADVKQDSSGTFLEIVEPRLYAITKNPKFGRHVLKLTSTSNSFGAYAFTFTTMCEEGKTGSGN